MSLEFFITHSWHTFPFPELFQGKKVKVDLLYGKSGLVLELPEDLDVTVMQFWKVFESTRKTVWPWYPAHIPMEEGYNGQ